MKNVYKRHRSGQNTLQPRSGKLPYHISPVKEPVPNWTSRHPKTSFAARFTFYFTFILATTVGLATWIEANLENMAEKKPNTIVNHETNDMIMIEITQMPLQENDLPTPVRKTSPNVPQPNAKLELFPLEIIIDEETSGEGPAPDPEPEITILYDDPYENLNKVFEGYRAHEEWQKRQSERSTK